MSETESERRRRRWINLGELIALAALIVSALGVWISWKGNDHDQPTRVVEQRQAIPLTLRGKREDDGTRLEISPVESSHALESLTVKLPGGSSIDVGSDGELRGSDVRDALSARAKEPKNQTLSIRAQVTAHYVEAGQEKSASAAYTLRYMRKGGGLFGSDSIHLVSLSR